MRQVWRWFGPDDKTTLPMVRQAGAAGIVTALHAVAPGMVWSPEAIAQRQSELAAYGFSWDVVESLPVSEAIKTQSGDWRDHFDAYRISMENLAAAGIEVICYNFMPVLDWTRTQLAAPMPHGGTAMNFDLIDFAVFDIHILKRPGAVNDFPEDVVETAGLRAAEMDNRVSNALIKAIGSGLPGDQIFSLDELRTRIADYERIDAPRLRRHFFGFLSEVVPHAEKLGLRLCCHPDDPPFDLLGLPRIMSCEADYQWLVDAVESPSNGITLCSGALGVRAETDLPGMVQRLGSHIHFVHLRNIRRLQRWSHQASFFEDEHLEGETDMPALILALLDEEARRRSDGRPNAEIPMRPDHGQDILDDLTRGGVAGYPAIGRLKGLAELRGVMHGLEHARRALT